MECCWGWEGGCTCCELLWWCRNPLPHAITHRHTLSPSVLATCNNSARGLSVHLIDKPTHTWLQSMRFKPIGSLSSAAVRFRVICECCFWKAHKHLMTTHDHSASASPAAGGDNVSSPSRTHSSLAEYLAHPSCDKIIFLLRLLLGSAADTPDGPVNCRC